MYKSIILPKAALDIQQAAKWYNSKQKGLGKRFLQAFRTKNQFICQNPYSIAIRYDAIRTAIIKGFPYMIHYTVDEQNKYIVISAVFHTSRDSEIWKLR